MSAQNFIALSIFFAAIGDASYLLFIKFALATKNNLSKWMQDYTWLPNMEQVLSNPELMDQMHQNFVRNINWLIGLVILINIIAYISFYKRKKRAVKYIRNLALTGFILGAFSVWEAREHGTIWITIMLFTLPLYFIIYRGLKHFKINF